MSNCQTSKRGVFVGRVARNEPICRQHYRLVIELEFLPPTRPGQFVQLQCRPLGEQTSHLESDWPEGAWPRLTQPELTGKEPLLRRPISIAGRGMGVPPTCATGVSPVSEEQQPGNSKDRGGAPLEYTARTGVPRTELELIYRTVGTGTNWLSRASVGDRISVLGPLGNGFTVLPDRPQAALIGGGVGVPPMIYQAEALAHAGKHAVAFCGARTAELLPLTVDCAKVSREGKPEMCAAEFARLGIPTVVATDDGTLGFAGNIVTAFNAWLDVHRPADTELAVYSCGPELMMKAAGLICISRGHVCQLAMERHMACGMGTCQSCIVKIRDPEEGPSTERGWSFKLCCTDGPVFDAQRIVW